MCIDICRSWKITVTKPFLNLLHENAVCQKQRGAAVSETVILDLSQAFCRGRFSASDAEKGKKMSLRNTIRSADFEATNFVFPQNAVAGFCADAEYFAHLFNAHYIRIILQHEFVGIALRNG